ncbi:Annexin A4, partial [Quaeritorhiza haematococci]
MQQIFVGRTNAELNAIKQAYETRYKKPIEEAVAQKVHGSLSKIFNIVLTVARDESEGVGNAQLTSDALYSNGEGRKSKEEAPITMFLCTRSFENLRAAFEIYARTRKKTIEEAIKKEFSGEQEKALLAIVHSIQDIHTFAAEQFEKSMKGLGVNDSKLIRLTVRFRNPPGQMKLIKEAYQK